MNTQYDGALENGRDFYITYTTDGSEPGPASTRYKAPFADPGKQIRARVYMNGKQSFTTLSKR